MTLQIRTGAVTDTGRVRNNNQDAYLVLEDRGLYAVADGMGGHRGGEVAAQLAVEALRAAYVEGADNALEEAITEANIRIFDVGSSDPNLQGMGTTMVAAAVLDGDGDTAGGQVLVANVGDSRAYLFRDGDLTQLTEDHSMVADLLREGRISEEEAEVHPQRNIVTRVLGVYDQVDIDFWPVDAVTGDRLVLCSDGLINEVTLDQIASVLRRLDDPQEAASELVRRANDGGGRDNITVLVLDVLDDGGVREAASEALAGEPRRPGTAHAEDLAGFATPIEDDTRSRSRATSTAEEPRERRSLRGRTTWRTIAFAVGVVLVIGGAFATIQWYGTSTYYVGFDGDEVAIFQGRPGGVLWIDAELEDRTGIERDEVPERYLRALDDGVEHSSLARANRYVSTIEGSILEQREREAATTTTTSSTVPGAVATTPTVTP